MDNPKKSRKYDSFDLALIANNKKIDKLYKERKRYKAERDMADLLKQKKRYE